MITKENLEAAIDGEMQMYANRHSGTFDPGQDFENGAKSLAPVVLLLAAALERYNDHENDAPVFYAQQALEQAAKLLGIGNEKEREE